MSRDHSAYPGTVLPGQYSSTLSSTVFLLFVHTSVETRFLYELKAVVLQSCKAFPEVPMVQRAALRAIWKGSLGRSPHRPSRPKKSFFFITPFFCRICLFFVTLHFAFSVTFTSLSLPHVPPYLHPPNFRDVSPISPPTLLHLCHTLPSLPSLPNPATNP